MAEDQAQAQMNHTLHVDGRDPYNTDLGSTEWMPEPGETTMERNERESPENQPDLSYERDFRITALIRGVASELILPHLDRDPEIMEQEAREEAKLRAAEEAQKNGGQVAPADGEQGGEGEEEVEEKPKKLEGILGFTEFNAIQCTEEVEASRFVAHTWTRPKDWDDQVYSRIYQDVKKVELNSLARLTAKQTLEDAQRHGEIEWFLDKTSIPAPISTEDHPLQRTSWGPFKMPIKDLHEMLTKDRPNKYSVLNLTTQWDFEGTLVLRERDIFLQPNINPTLVPITWTIDVGSYFLRTVDVVNQQDGLEEFNNSPQYSSGGPMTLREWQRSIGLPDSAWVELHVGSVRSELITNYADVLSYHAKMSVVLPWHFCDRLWSLSEWAVFLKYRPLYNAEILFEQLLQPKTLPGYVRNIRLLSIENAVVADQRDREFLLRSLISQFHVVEITTYDLNVQNPDTMIGVDRVKVVTPQWHPLEQFIRGSLIAVIARTLALAEGRSSVSRDQQQTWHEPWVNLARECDLEGLALALNEMKAYKMDRDQIIKFFNQDVLRQVEILRQEILPENDTGKGFLCKKAD